MKNLLDVFNTGSIDCRTDINGKREETDFEGDEEPFPS
jgi:hypothetical protein